MAKAAHKVREAPGGGLRGVGRIEDEPAPLVFRGLAAGWPVVEAARRSSRAAIAYLRGFCKDASVAVSFGRAGGDRRLAYNDDLGGFNFTMDRKKLADVLSILEELCDDPSAPVCYVGSTTVDKCLPGLRSENDIDLDGRSALASIWIGNRAVIGAHFDALYNLACVAAGRRRVTLFPPEEVENLYVGPLDLTPAGQPVSLVDFNNYDAAAHPRFEAALERALVAELGPGDALYIPSAWWHHVESLDSFNVLVNYWWRDSPAYMGNPMDALTHALLSLRDLPQAERDRWRSLFDHYVFDWESGRAAHIPAQGRGSLGPVDDAAARRLRAALLNRLNR